MSSARVPALSPADIKSSGLCIGCGGCAARGLDTGALMEMDPFGQYKPQGSDRFLRTRTAEFARICPFSPAASNEDDLARPRFAPTGTRDTRLGWFEGAYVGAAAESDFRANGSSGGLVSWVAAELLRLGLVDGVAHVRPDAGSDTFFRYTISRTPEELHRGAKSRYYPVELSGVLDEIRRVPGRYAIVAIPCFTKAIHLQRQNDPVLAERIAFTLGLFCGHMKSARLVESFAWQLGTSIEEVRQPEYRLKDPSRPANWYTAHLTLQDGTTRQQDWMHLVDGDWGAGFFMNSACNFCDDVVAETADIAFGDAWVEPHSSNGKGTNVVVVRSPQLHAIMEAAMGEGRLNLEAVDADYIVGTQAAGFRQRREGLAYRLTWFRRGIRPRKRVAPSRDLKLRRKLIYRMRYAISWWSHRLFWLARRTGRPPIYTRWAAGALKTYQGLTWGHGKVGQWVAKLGLSGKDG